MNTLISFLEAHWVGVSTAVGYVVLAAVTALAPKWDGWYNWFYRFTQALPPIARHEAQVPKSTPGA